VGVCSNLSAGGVSPCAIANTDRIDRQMRIASFFMIASFVFDNFGNRGQEILTS
jgi:hypothetical protein